MEKVKSKTKAAVVAKPKTRWVYVVKQDDKGQHSVVGKKLVNDDYKIDESKGEYEKYTNGARQEAVKSITAQLDALRKHRHQVYMTSAKKLKVLE